MKNDAFPVPGARRALLYVMALAFLTMSLVSVRQRILHPDIVVPSNPGRMRAELDTVPDEANEISVLMRKIQQNSGDVDAMTHLAEHFINERNWQAAENFLRRAVVAAPANAQPLYLLGVTLHNLAKHEEAAACFERVLSLRDEPSARYSLGILCIYYLHDAERGAVHLRHALTQPGLQEDLAKLILEELNALSRQKQGEPTPRGKKPPAETMR